jgi:hypothetical protein
MDRIRVYSRGFFATCLSLVLLLWACPDQASAKTDAIWIAPARAAGKPSGQPGQSHHPAGHGESSSQQSSRPPQAKQIGRPAGPPPKAKQSGRPGGRPGGSGGEHAGHGGSSGRFESEHRPMSVRTYKIVPEQLLPDAKAMILQADGTPKDLAVETCHTNVFSVKLPMDDGPLHGPNNIYIVDQQVKDGVLEVRTAKWLTIHHSCGWGHDYRNDPERLKARSLESAPLDIVVDDLWDGNFHNGLHSGDDLVIRIFSYGKPLAGAAVTITSEKGWTKRTRTGADGIARVQLIRDYYPSTWQVFKRTELGKLALTAEFTEKVPSSYNGEAVGKTHYVTSFSWKYVPASDDYNSYSYGLLLGSLGFLGSGFGVYQYRLKRRKPKKKVVFDD